MGVGQFGRPNDSASVGAGPVLSTKLPVPAYLLVYTRDEGKRYLSGGPAPADSRPPGQEARAGGAGPHHSDNCLSHPDATRAVSRPGRDQWVAVPIGLPGHMAHPTKISPRQFPRACSECRGAKQPLLLGGAYQIFRSSWRADSGSLRHGESLHEVHGRIARVEGLIVISEYSK